MNSKIIFIRLTTKCNANCRMCSIWKRKPEHFKYNTLLDILLFFKSKGYANVIFTGGEPTLYPKFTLLNKFLKDNNLNFGLITNGSTLVDNWDKLFKYKLPNGIIFSLDSVDDYHSKNRGIKNLTTIVISGIKKAQRMNIKTSINTVITNVNYKKIIKFSEFDFIEKVDEWHLIPVKFNNDLHLTKTQWIEFNTIYNNIKNKSKIISSFNFKANIDFDNLEREEYTSKFYLKNACRICEKMIFIDINGNIYRCNSFDNNSDSFCLFGNFKKEDLNKIYTKIKKSPILEKPTCKNCDPRNQLYNKKGVLFENWFN